PTQLTQTHTHTQWELICNTQTNKYINTSILHACTHTHTRTQTHKHTHTHTHTHISRNYRSVPSLCPCVPVLLSIRVQERSIEVGAGFLNAAPGSRGIIMQMKLAPL